MTEPLTMPTEASTGLRAVAGGNASPREKLPMLPVVLDRWAGLLTGTLRKVLGGDVEAVVSLLRPVRFSAVIEEVQSPAHLSVLRGAGVDGCALVTIGPDFAGLVFDALLGAPPAGDQATPPSRPFTAIENAILARVVAATLPDLAAAFEAIAPVTFAFERSEAEPRLADIARPADTVWSATVSVALDGRRANLGLVLPDAALEPIRSRLAQDFMGVKFGGDEHWAAHLATAIWSADIEASALLHEARLPLRRVLDLAVGDTLMFERRPGDLVEVRSGGFTLTRGRIGRVDGRIAVQVVEPLRRLSGRAA